MPRRQQNGGVRVQSVACMRRRSVRTRESSSGAATMAGARQQREEEEEACERRTRGPPCGLYRRRGKGSGIGMYRWSFVWPGVAGVREKPNRQIGTEDPGVGKRGVRRGCRGLRLRPIVRGTWALAH